MAYVMQVSFDSYWKILKPSYVFKFRGREYRLLRGKRQRGGIELDCILTILNEYDEKECDKVYRDIMIYCGCLSWERHTPIIVGGGGGYGAKEVTIKRAGRVDTTNRILPISMLNLTIERIPYVYTKDQEDALGLYREAIASGSPFYKFLCLWNILNIPYREESLVLDWINNARRNKRHRFFSNKLIEELEKEGINIGEYLKEQCRNAIVHIRRYTLAMKHIDPNNPEDLGRIGTVVYFLENLVELYVIEELKLNKMQFLFNFKKRGIPEYKTEEEMKKNIYGVK